MFVAGQSGSQAAVAAVRLADGRDSRPAIIRIPGSVQTTHLFIDESDGTQLFGSALDHSNNVDLYTMKLTENASVEESSLKAIKLSQVAQVSSMLSHLKENRMHLVVKTQAAKHVYIVYDLTTNLVQLAVPVNVPKASFMSLLSHKSAEEVQATFVVPQQNKKNKFGLYQASFSEQEGQEEACAWDFVLESMHIAFAQQEARAFEQSAFDETPIDAAAKATSEDPQMFAGEEDRDERNYDEDGDDEYDFTSEGSSTLGDIRVSYSDDADDEDKKKKKNRRSRRILRRSLNALKDAEKALQEALKKA